MIFILNHERTYTHGSETEDEGIFIDGQKKRKSTKKDKGNLKK